MTFLLALLAYNLSLKNPEPSQPVRYRMMLVTSYDKESSCHYPVKEGCLNAAGKIARKGTVACPRSVALGTKLEINGKEYICEDRYNKNLSERLDIWQDSHEAALRFGAQLLPVRIVK